MPLELTDFEHPSICHGYVWQVRDKPLLAELVAEVLLGQYRHVRKVLMNLKSTPRVVDIDEIEKAIEVLTLVEGKKLYLRDGWVFQCISWVAARCTEGPNAILSPPHMGTARKGFDSVLLVLADDGSTVERVYIGEDKATEDARHMIQYSVWPEIEVLEKGERRAEIRSEVTTLLERKLSQDDERIERLIDQALWQDTRAYRVAVTASDAYDSSDGREELFEGYDTCASGLVRKRRAETFHHPAVRDWMEHFCGLVVERLNSYREESHV